MQLQMHYKLSLYTDCFRPSDFHHPACNSSWEDSRKRRHAFENEDGVTYGDIFTGYSSEIKIRKDVAEFVSLSKTWKRNIGLDEFAR